MKLFEKGKWYVFFIMALTLLTFVGNAKADEIIQLEPTQSWSLNLSWQINFTDPVIGQNIYYYKAGQGSGSGAGGSVPTQAFRVELNPNDRQYTINGFSIEDVWCFYFEAWSISEYEQTEQRCKGPSLKIQLDSAFE